MEPSEKVYVPICVSPVNSDLMFLIIPGLSFIFSCAKEHNGNNEKNNDKTMPLLMSLYICLTRKGYFKFATRKILDGHFPYVIGSYLAQGLHSVAVKLFRQP